jgi:hypothetical protein
MDAYMRENKIPEIKPESEAPATPEKNEVKPAANAAPEAVNPAPASDALAAKSPAAKSDATTKEAKAPAPERRPRPALAR